MNNLFLKLRKPSYIKYLFVPKLQQVSMFLQLYTYDYFINIWENAILIKMQI